MASLRPCLGFALAKPPNVRVFACGRGISCDTGVVDTVHPGSLLLAVLWRGIHDIRDVPPDALLLELLADEEDEWDVLLSADARDVVSAQPQRHAHFRVEGAAGVPVPYPPCLT